MISQDSSKSIDTLSNYHNAVLVLYWVQLLEIFATMFSARLSFSISFELPKAGFLSSLLRLQYSSQHSRFPTVWDMQMLPQYLKRRNNNRKQSRENPGAPAGKHHLKAL